MPSGSPVSQAGQGVGDRLCVEAAQQVLAFDRHACLCCEHLEHRGQVRCVGVTQGERRDEHRDGAAGHDDGGIDGGLDADTEHRLERRDRFEVNARIGGHVRHVLRASRVE